MYIAPFYSISQYISHIMIFIEKQNLKMRYKEAAQYNWKLWKSNGKKDEILVEIWKPQWTRQCEFYEAAGFTVEE